MKNPNTITLYIIYINYDLKKKKVFNKNITLKNDLSVLLAEINDYA